MLLLPEHDRCILSMNYNHQFLPIEFYWQDQQIQNNNPGDKVCLYAGTNNMSAVLLFHVPAHNECDRNWRYLSF